jgi:DNA-binding NtrC family response regulator
MSLATQARILRAIEDRRVERIGAAKPVDIDLRILAASNKDLEQEVAAGRFREDLLFRLRVVELAVPPLRDRREDILPLAEHFLRRLTGTRVSLDARAKEALRAHAWPGNVRELRNVIERAVVLCEGRVIRPEHLPARVAESGAEATRLRSFAEVEKEHLARVLEATSRNVAAAARVLGISRNTLYARVRRHGLDRLLS